ncbi:MAG TPA: DNA topoisomerase, partial [Azospirillum sp.]|nr:DNA topoisomerase [Azospirillum sp.]
MAGSNVVIVESPAKAKTINKYLGSDYTVVASFGHVRDLPARDGSVRPEEDFAMDWELGDRSKRHIDEIAKALKGATRVYLATDPDREGEAIAWHLSELLREKHLIDTVEVQRITFNEITKSAVQAALAAPRAVSRELVDAYLARRALDYLVGFTLSPVLWRKLPGSKSAGRVQSVALRLVCEREAEIEAFRPQEYWSVEADFATPAGAAFTAHLSQLDGRKLDKFALPNQAAAEAAVARIQGGEPFTVGTVERRQSRRNPYAPFTTSTLQQEASRKLGFGATRTMRVAQRLYEGVDIGGETVGLITYMRTDGVSLSQEAIEASRALIGSLWGDKYVPGQPR